MHKFLKIAALAVLLGGCQTTGQGAGTGTVSGVGEAAAPSEKVATLHVIRFDAAEFNGFSPERVLPVLGAPDFVRRDGDAQIWQYRATNCVLDLFLYKAGSDSVVKYAELRPRAPEAEPLDACYSRMRQDRKTQPSG